MELLRALIPLVLLPVCFAGCDKKYFSKCICGMSEYGGKMQYVVNCTDTGFQNASVLSHLPEEVEVLIFTGNDIAELPWNVFGMKNNNTRLRVVDMSRNNIKEIRGKTYHRVPNVEMLILNHNQISISSENGSKHHHPRVFSNFESLLELHLTNAFVDNSSDQLAADLHDIFSNSDLTKLQKLHLEQNEIRTFKDPLLFCDLVDLMDIYLGDNLLEHIDFEIDCLHHLRFIDLERNAIKALSPRDMSKLDFLPQRGQNLTIDFNGNPLACGCDIQQLYSWLQNTQVDVRQKNKLRCKHEDLFDVKGQPKPTSVPNCTTHKFLTVPEAPTCPLKSSATVAFLSIALLCCMSLLFYTNRLFLHNKFWILVMTLRRKVHYTNIGKQDAQEMDV